MATPTLSISNQQEPLTTESKAKAMRIKRVIRVELRPKQVATNLEVTDMGGDTSPFKRTEPGWMPVKCHEG